MSEDAVLNNWFATSLGAALLAEESRYMDNWLPEVFGYHLVQVGNVGAGRLLSASRIRHRCLLARCPCARGYDLVRNRISAAPEALPFAADSVDALILPHVLEFAAAPHQILREAERVLISEGRLVLFCFNPLSLWGLRRALPTRDKAPPWNGRFRTALRLKDWLALLDFEVLRHDSLYFSLPLEPRHYLRRFAWLENVGSRYWPRYGAVTVLIAKKRRPGLTPLKPAWQVPSSPLLGAVEPINFTPEKSMED